MVFLSGRDSGLIHDIHLTAAVAIPTECGMDIVRRDDGPLRMLPERDFQLRVTV